MVPLRLAAALLATLLAASSAFAAVVDGATGTANFEIPIDVLPGPGGFAPNLTLRYSSAGGDGPFGVGWQLPMGEIRCSSRFGVESPAACTRYELNGSLLTEDPQTPGRYHTFVESFQRITHQGGSGPGTGWWLVEQTDGSKQYFGETPAGRVSQGGSTAEWKLERLEDAFGNPIFISYDDGGGDAGFAYPTRVTYGAGATAAAGPREVRFVYETRTDPIEHFAGGIERRLTRRLREIQVLGNGLVTRRYVFGYDHPSIVYSTGRSRLSWVQEFGTDCGLGATDPVSQCAGLGLPRRTFEYSDPSEVAQAGPHSQWAENDQYRILFGTYADLRYGYNLYSDDYPRLLGDINGDGLVDQITLPTDYSGYPLPINVLLNTGTGFAASNSGSGAISDEAAAYLQSLIRCRTRHPDSIIS